MPNRILKESICSSEQINTLTAEEEAFFYRLIVVCDDFGLMDARLPILKARCYPLKSIDINKIKENLAALVTAGLVITYIANEKPYLKLAKWEDHQQIRAKRAKYPTLDIGVISTDIKCHQLYAVAPVIQSNPIQSKDAPPAEEAHSAPDDLASVIFGSCETILGPKGRALVGQARKRVGEQKVLEVLAHISGAKPQISDPVPYFVRATSPKERGVCL